LLQNTFGVSPVSRVDVAKRFGEIHPGVSPASLDAGTSSGGVPGLSTQLLCIQVAKEAGTFARRTSKTAASRNSREGIGDERLSDQAM